MYKCKTNYQTPVVEIVEIAIEAAVLVASGSTDSGVSSVTSAAVSKVSNW